MNTDDGVTQVLEALDAKRLRALLDENRLSVADRRYREPMIALLSSFYSSLETLLFDLEQADLEYICAYFDIAQGESRLGTINAIVDLFTLQNDEDFDDGEADLVDNYRRPNSEGPGLSGPRNSQQAESGLRYALSSEAAGSLTEPGSSSTVTRSALLWKFFIMPGVVIAWVQYMFPASGGVIASGRRKDNPVVHVIFSFAFWAFVLFQFLRVSHPQP